VPQIGQLKSVIGLLVAQNLELLTDFYLIESDFVVVSAGFADVVPFEEGFVAAELVVSVAFCASRSFFSPALYDSLR
jgi:hypothetical protein